MKTILILALDGMMDSSLAITLDTLRTAQGFLASAGKPGRIRIATAGYGRSIRTGAGLRMTPDATFREVADSGARPEWVVVPGLGVTSEAEIGPRFAKKDAIEACRLLQAMDGAGVKIGASCSSVFLLAQAGLLAGRRATMTWWLAHAFRRLHPDVALDESRMLARDRNILTAGSAYSQLDLALAIVTDAAGAAVAQLCSRYLLIDQRPSQAKYMIPSHIRHNDATVVAAERWIDAHLSGPISIPALSSMLAVSPKTLARRIDAATGMTPLRFIQRRRLMRAAHLIETTALSIDRIATQVGYQDGTALRKLVKREFGTTPRALR
jgi:transcriptional regulator GlxA family with amidase domain